MTDGPIEDFFISTVSYDAPPVDFVRDAQKTIERVRDGQSANVKRDLTGAMVTLEIVRRRLNSSSAAPWWRRLLVWLNGGA